MTRGFRIKNLPKKSSEFFSLLLIGTCLALTGCAAGRYDGSGLAQQPAGTPIGLEPIGRPVDGKVVIPYGSSVDGVLSKGVWIEGGAGSTVKAAQEGRVVFVHERMEGYGKTVILEHAGEVRTVYAHLAEIVTRVGRAVQKGDPVGKLDHRHKRLYFEFRRHDVAEDPEGSW